jgi:2-dehydro-3-deoxy-D-gluconate 5-dehydrogenase
MNSFLETTFGLEGKTALVTGCRRGIGAAMALALAQAGADILGVSVNLEVSGSRISRQVEACGRRFVPYACDFADRGALYRFIAGLVAEHPVLDILVNNAGTILREPAAQHSDDYWDKVIQVNLTSAFILTREIGKRMLQRRSGKIIFTSSLLAFQGGINVPSYAASKGGIGQMVKAFANEWAYSGVNVNAIAPGYIETDNTVALRNDPARNQAILSRIPAGRWGKPRDLGGAVVFLASAASDYLHGTTLIVDGGWMGR